MLTPFMTQEQISTELVQQAQQERLIEAGGEMLRGNGVTPDIPAAQLDALRVAFFAGAEHMFLSFYWLLGSADAKVTAQNTFCVDAIYAEVTAFARELALRRTPIGGTA